VETNPALEIERQQIEQAKRDPRHFAPLYNAYFETIFRFIHSRVRDKDLTGDLCSQTFTKALFALKGYKFMGYPLSTWLFRIALNEVNMHFRKQKKEQLVPISEQQLGELSEEVGDEDETRDLENLIIGMNLLDEANTDILEMRFFEKRRFAEIGQILGISEDNAKMRVYRAVKKLKELMKERS
jgi:RNA polymerase sigma-70 factor, ECF subfamily